MLVRLLFRIPDSDVGSPTKIFKSHIARHIQPVSNSPFANAEIIIRARMLGISVGSIGVQSHPRVFGRSSVVSFKNVLTTLKDMLSFRVSVSKEPKELLGQVKS